jgi:NAD(P)-dependent dehydrogenase (short-subunit alcohol dehydrogenase family)
MTGKGQTALVTGASMGIGVDLAECFAKDGYDLVLTARSEAALKDVADRLAKTYGGEGSHRPGRSRRAGERRGARERDRRAGPHGRRPRQQRREASCTAACGGADLPGLSAWREMPWRMRAKGRAQSATVSEDHEAALRALGYIE